MNAAAMVSCIDHPVDATRTKGFSMLPSTLYEALPYLYMTFGAMAFLGIGEVAGQVCALLLMLIGFKVYRMRVRHRKGLAFNPALTSRDW